MSRCRGARSVTSRPSIEIEPLGHLLQPGECAKQRRLPAAGRADESDELAVRDLERDVVEGDDIAGEDLGDVLEDDLGHGEGYTDTTF